MIAAPSPLPSPVSDAPSAGVSVAPSSSSTQPAAEGPTWADQLEAWSTLGGAFVALAAAIATIWLLVHQIGEARQARADAHQERAEAAVDRELARQDRELAAAERRDAEMAQARAVVVGDIQRSFTFITATPGSTKHVYLTRLIASVTNYSLQPILTVQLYADSAGTAGDWPILLKETAVLGPGETLEHNGFVEDGSDLGPTEEEADTNLSIYVTFTDAAGRRWRRPYEQQPQAVLDTPSAGGGLCAPSV